MPTVCPICQTKLVKKEEEVNLFCPNIDCQGRQLESIIHFASKDAMDIEGLGESLIEELFSLHYLNSITDIYTLETKKDSIQKLEGWGEKSLTKLINNINKSKDNSLERLLFGLGIKELGQKSAKVLSLHFKNIDAIIKADLPSLISIRDFGEVMAKEIIAFFANAKNLELIETLKSYQVNMLDKNIVLLDTFYSHKTFVITGSFTKYSRDDLTRLLESKGAKVSSSVTSKTNYLLCGSDSGSKLDKAKSLNVKIIFEDELDDFLAK
jgi:DNA ligase (NAD+)